MKRRKGKEREFDKNISPVFVWDMRRQKRKEGESEKWIGGKGKRGRVTNEKRERERGERMKNEKREREEGEECKMKRGKGKGKEGEEWTNEKRERERGNVQSIVGLVGILVPYFNSKAIFTLSIITINIWK